MDASITWTPCAEFQYQMGNLGPGSEEAKEVLSIPNYLVYMCTVSCRGEINLEGGAELEQYTCGA